MTERNGAVEDDRASLLKLRTQLLHCCDQVVAEMEHMESRRREQEASFRAETDRQEGRRRYEEVVFQIRDAVQTAAPAGSTVLVVSKGDDTLLRLGNRTGWHFPRDEAGGYAGHHPADAAEAIAHLEALRGRGAEFLLFPSTAFWWLDHYKEFKRHLESHYRLVLRRAETCLLYRLRDPGDEDPEWDFPGRAVDPASMPLLREQIREVVRSLLPVDATVLVASQGDEDLLKLDGRPAWHFPQSGHAADAPADEAATVAHLETLRARGADYLLIPSVAFGWLRHHRQLKEHLRVRHRIVMAQEHVCLIFALSEQPAWATCN